MSDYRHFKNGGALQECAAAHAGGGRVLEGGTYKSGGRLTAKQRNAMPAKSFAGPDRSYPINDASHARNALARVSQFGSPALKAKVRSAVHRKYPGIGKG